MSNEIQYNALLEFISLADISNRQFAELAHIAPTTFQNMIYRKSRISHERFNLISLAMCKILEQKSDSDKRQRLEELYLTYNYSMDMTGHRLSGSLSGIQTALEGAIGTNPLKLQLDAAFNKLNDKGQLEAIKRVEDLTYNPDYQKESKE